MKILITTDLYTPAVNGVVRSALNLIDELNARGHQVKVLTLSNGRHSYEKDGVTYLGSLDVSFIYPNARIRSARGRKYIRDIMRWRPDIIHSQCEFSTFLIGKDIARELSIPLVHTYHTVYEDYVRYIGIRKSRFSKRLVKWVTKFVTDRCDAVIAPSQKVEKLLLSYGVTSPLSVIPTGIDLSPFTRELAAKTREEMKRALGIPLEDRVLVFVGRLGREKNIEEVIQFFNRLSLPGLSLLLVGDGPDRKRLEELAKLSEYSQKIFFSGMVPPEMVADYYKLGDIFVNASVSETQGLTYIEAMASGLPVVCRRDGCLEGVVFSGENGFLYDDYAAFSQSVKRLIQGEDTLTVMGKKAREIACRDFSKESFGKSAELLYQSLIR